jgi:hypothetical protein
MCKKDIDLFVLGDASTQHRLKFGLNKRDGRPPTKWIGRLHRIKNSDDAAIDAEIVVAGMRCDEFLDLTGHAAGLKDTHDLMVETDCARLVVDSL